MPIRGLFVLSFPFLKNFLCCERKGIFFVKSEIPETLFLSDMKFSRIGVKGKGKRSEMSVSEIVSLFFHGPLSLTFSLSYIPKMQTVWSRISKVNVTRIRFHVWGDRLFIMEILICARRARNSKKYGQKIDGKWKNNGWKRDENERMK